MVVAVQKALFGHDRSLGDVVEKVTSVLERYPETRDSYKRLMVRYWAEYDGLSDLMDRGQLHRFTQWFEARATSAKTLQNRAGEIQNDRPDLEASAPMAKQRRWQAHQGRVT